MLRQDLLKALNTVKGAINTKDIVPVLTCFCFTGEEIYAYNDVICVTTQFSCAFSGALRAAPLLAFLNASGAKEVEFLEEGPEVKIKAGKASINLSKMEPDAFVFTKPDGAPLGVLPGDNFAEALRNACGSMGTDSTSPSRMGVTLAFAKGRALLYSTDNILATEVILETKVPKALASTVAALSPIFCNECSGAGKLKEIQIAEEWVLAVYETHTVFGQTTLGADVQAYTDIIHASFEGAVSIPVPKGLDRALERAKAVADEKDSTKAKTKDGVLLLKTDTTMGKVLDKVQLAEGVDIEAALEFYPHHMSRALDGALEMGFTDGILTLTYPWGRRIMTLLSGGAQA